MGFNTESHMTFLKKKIYFDILYLKFEAKYKRK
jgi:hypothetical protein